jgi:hypothetical protein
MKKLSTGLACAGFALAGISAVGFSEPSTGPTYSEDVAEILNKRCVHCHRPDEVAPFSLIGYENARKWAPNIARVTAERSMPPWKAEPGIRKYHDDSRLTDEEIRILQEWNRGEKRVGDPAKAPPIPEFPAGWELGEPDVVYQVPRPIKLTGEGTDEYRCFVFKTNFKETRYVTAMDFKPGNRRIAHHALVYTDSDGDAIRVDEEDKDGQEGFVAPGVINLGFGPDDMPYIWGPGVRPRHMPPGVAFRLKPGAALVVQVHYHRTGIEETDQSRLGLYFAKEPPKKVANVEMVLDGLLYLPPNEKRIERVHQFYLPRDSIIYRVLPHMHNLGKEMKVEVKLPDGKKETLVHVKGFDFKWQIEYALQEPVFVPKGTMIVVTGIFDNSSSNPSNPNNPPKPVIFGPNSDDEMLMALVTISPAADRKP